ncbi:XLF-domain-containing protein [Hypoxylon fuscum]|nr:XLF-domain-containing protein [Hypoxylon fuscum]
MASRLRWHPLPAFPHVPALMISPNLAASSYTLHVTDLANVWTESLDRKGILLRSLQENTSIDLSDGDPNQWAVFLSKLNAAFDSTSPDHHGTALSISASSPDKTYEASLVLHVTCVLPKPLKPLRWPIYLTKCPPAELASELVLPLIQAQHERNLEIEDLIVRLKEKDVVITKLVDKLEGMQTGLEHVFNSLSGKRKPSRALAEDKVKGLAAFDTSDWKSTMNLNKELPRDVPSLVHKVFTEVGLHCKVDREVGASSQLNDWWTKLDPSPTTAIRPQQETPKKPLDNPPRDTTATEKEDDDFQVQATPPRLLARRQKEGHSQAADDSTDDDGSPVIVPDSHPTLSQEQSRARIGALGGRKTVVNKDNSASQSSRTILADDETASESEEEAVQPRSPKRPSTRIGTIGKARETTPAPAMSSPPAPPPPNTDDDDVTASGSGSDGDGHEPPKSRSSPSAPPAQRKKPGLGRIGGKPKARVTPEPSEDPKTTSPDIGNPKAAASPAKPAGRKIGTIGKKPDPEGKRQRSDSPATTQDIELETEEQRAERRRLEIAKDLERKAAVPTKKKRRF